MAKGNSSMLELNPVVVLLVRGVRIGITEGYRHISTFLLARRRIE
jgi:hypothetical protein